MGAGRPTEERLTIGPTARALEAVLARPTGDARAGVVVCHPHPEYGGAMDNPVVTAIAAALVDRELAVLRFTFGGVGRSGGGYTGGPGEVDDVRVALAALASRLPSGVPLALVGYSFGAWAAVRAAGETAGLGHVVAVGPPLSFLDWDGLAAVTAPVTFVVGDRDQFCPAAQLAATLATHGDRIVCRRLGGADHFLAGREREAATVVADALSALVLPPAGR